MSNNVTIHSGVSLGSFSYDLIIVSNRFMLNLFLDLPANGLYFLVYEYIQDVAKANSKTGEINTASTIFAGGAAGMAYWVLGMPADVLKSRLQSGK